MHYEVVSRALAYVSCLSTLSLFLTSMSIAAINVGKGQTVARCTTEACAVVAPKPVANLGVQLGTTKLETVAVVFEAD